MAVNPQLTQEQVRATSRYNHQPSDYNLGYMQGIQHIVQNKGFIDFSKQKKAMELGSLHYRNGYNTAIEWYHQAEL